MAGVQCEMLDRLQRRCAELENQLTLERQKYDAQLGGVQQRQADEIISHYKQRVKVVEKEKQVVSADLLLFYYVINSECKYVVLHSVENIYNSLFTLSKHVPLCVGYLNSILFYFQEL
jgi:archaellum component FlaC